MFSIRSSAIMLLLLAAASGPVLAETLVVRSSGPSANRYPPGKAIAEGSRIILKAHDQLVILDGRGTRTLKGPGSFSSTQESASAAADTRSTFAALVSQRSERRARIGAVRGAPPPSTETQPNRPPNIWFVDIARSSPICVVDPATLTLWRADAAPPAIITLTGPDGKALTIAWRAGQSVSAWPASAPISEGAVYKIAWVGAAQPTTLSFQMLGPNPEGLEDMAAALIKRKCDAQLDLLVETVALPGG